jgi:tRNA-2-methylthio-N6-dimethylallyladenosine synthase
VTTDLIVGFPGETEADFADTLAVVDDAAYDAAYTFVFSPRPGTPAAAMTDDFVPAEVAKDRMRRLIEVVERHAAGKHAARLGRVEQVLVVGPSKRDDAQPVHEGGDGVRQWSGRTRQDKLVHFAAPATGATGPLVPGSMAEVRIERAAAHWLAGEVLDVTPPARRGRVRIPVVAAP